MGWNRKLKVYSKKYLFTLVCTVLFAGCDRGSLIEELSPSANQTSENPYEQEIEGFSLPDKISDVTSSTLPNDLNKDNKVDAEDVNYICKNIQEKSNLKTLDSNSDSIVDQKDLHAYLDSIGIRNGNVNFDNTVDGEDYIVWQENKFAKDSLWANGDFNCDGTVNVSDFEIWNENKFLAIK